MSLMVIGVVIDSRLRILCEDLCKNRELRLAQHRFETALYLPSVGPTSR
jgi:hypothetical protein